VVLLLEHHGISAHNVSAHTLRKRFILKDHYGALTKEEFKLIRDLAEQVKKRAYLINGASKKGKPIWNSGINESDPRYNEWVKKVAVGRDNFYKST
jgi:hypothetical protein